MLVLNRKVDKNLLVKCSFFLTEDPVLLMRVSASQNGSTSLRYIYVRVLCRLDTYLSGEKKGHL